MRSQTSRLYFMTPARRKGANRKLYQSYDWAWQPKREKEVFEVHTVVGSVCGEFGITPQKARKILRGLGMSAPYQDKELIRARLQEHLEPK